MASLLPGYIHVDHFGNDSEYESGEEEVAYISLDLVQAEPQLIPQTSSYRLAGLDTPTPFLQLQGTTFRGEHVELLGSEIIFTNGRDIANPSHRFVVPLSTTSTRIRFHEVSVRAPDQVEAERPRPKTLSQKQKAQRHARIARVLDSSTPRKRRSRKKKGFDDEEADDMHVDQDEAVPDDDEQSGADSDAYVEATPQATTSPQPKPRASRKAKEKAKESVQAAAAAMNMAEEHNQDD